MQDRREPTTHNLLDPNIDINPYLSDTLPSTGRHNLQSKYEEVVSLPQLFTDFLVGEMFMLTVLACF